METSSCPPALAAGDVLCGRYELLQPLLPTAAVVWQALDRRLRRRVAVKLARPDAPIDHELRLQGSVCSDRVVAVLDAGQLDDGTGFLVLEYVPGLDLDELVLRGGPTPAARAVHILQQLCEALGEVHARGVVHGDVKPGNVLCRPPGFRHERVQLADFGLASRGGPRGTGYVLGSAPFMAPEVALDRVDVGTPADVYGFGTVAVWLLTGRLLYEGDPLAVLAAQVCAPVPVRARTDIAPLEDLVDACLEKEPWRRPTILAVQEQLARAASQAAVWTLAEAREWWATHAPDLAR